MTDRLFDVDHAIPFSLWHNNDLWNLLPADARINNEKRDRLADRETLFRSREAIIGCWQITRHAMPERFDLELSRTLFGRNHAEAQWEAPAFAALSEAVETVAVQRGVERWQPATSAVRGTKVRASCTLQTAVKSESSDAGDSLYQPLQPLPILDLDGKRSAARYHVLPQGRTLLDPAEVPHRAFKSALPIVAELAAGPFFDGFETGRLEDLTGLDWIAVPEKLCKLNRFVIRVAGDSMAPLFHIGDLLVFEYHRTPRQDNQIVIAADFTSGSEGGAYAVKRFKTDPGTWLFLSDNPAYEHVKIPKAEMSHPILGTYVGRL
ncbi:MAG: S24 family peptidase [bacterium]